MCEKRRMSTIGVTGVSIWSAYATNLDVWYVSPYNEGTKETYHCLIYFMTIICRLRHKFNFSFLPGWLGEQTKYVTIRTDYRDIRRWRDWSRPVGEYTYLVGISDIYLPLPVVQMLPTMIQEMSRHSIHILHITWSNRSHIYTVINNSDTISSSLSWLVLRSG